jgi:aminopeptidase N
MGTLATAEATEFKDAWQGFYSGGKQAAYAQDQTASTHPIEVPVPSTANAFDNIDAITYSKGASTLKQLRHLLGEEVFRKGVHNYLTKFSYQNATLDDFIGALGAAAGRDLQAWTAEWLYQAGVNTVAASYQCKAGRISSFSLQQSAPSAALPTLREQRVQVATFKLSGDQLVLGKNVAVTYRGAATPVPGLVGSACPDLVYPNYQDWGFVKIALDARSRATARAHLAKVDDPLLRAMLWQSLWDGVRDGKTSVLDFIDTALRNAPTEQDYTLLGDVLGKVSLARQLLDRMHVDTPATRRASLALEAMAWQGVLANAGNGDFQRRWLGNYLDQAASHAAQQRLAGLLDGSVKVEGLALNQDLRWDILQQLSRRDYPGSAALVSAEAARDKSAAGQAAAIAAEVARPDAATKARWLATIQDTNTTLPFSQVRVAMFDLYPAEQGALSEATAGQRLAQLAVLDRSAGPVYMRAYAGAMIPANCTPASVARLAQASSSMTQLSALTRRSLQNRLEEDQRCVAVKRRMTSAR